jgi:hypothetical protein
MLNGVAEVVAFTRPGHRVRRSHVGAGIDIGFGVVSVGLIAGPTSSKTMASLASVTKVKDNRVHGRMHPTLAMTSVPMALKNYS